MVFMALDLKHLWLVDGDVPEGVFENNNQHSSWGKWISVQA